jgi:hypothetical protein
LRPLRQIAASRHGLHRQLSAGGRTQDLRMPGKFDHDRWKLSGVLAHCRLEIFTFILTW